MTISEKERKFLENHAVAHLATINEQGYPHVTPIFYVLASDRIFFVASAQSQKLALMAHDPRVGLSITDEADLSTVRIEGDAKVLTDTDVSHMEIIDTISRLSSLHSKNAFPPVMQMDKGAVTLVEITIRTLTFATYHGRH